MSATKLLLAAIIGGMFSPSPSGQVVMTAASTDWTCPAGVTEVSILCVGRGGPYNGSGGRHGGGGGSLSYRNNVAVVPGRTYRVFIDTSVTYVLDLTSFAVLCRANAATDRTGAAAYTANGETSFAGGDGGSGFSSTVAGGGGGAAGYSGVGGNGAGWTTSAGTGATAGSGGGGGGGQARGSSSGRCGGGGGVGLLGEGASGAAGSTTARQGQGGSGGLPANNTTLSTNGGNYGGGAGGPSSGAGQPGGGACRIIWGPGRRYPDNAGDYIPDGEVIFENTTLSLTTFSFVVPDSVTSICGVAVGTTGGIDSAGYGSGGAGLSYRNDIPVTPGETLTVTFQAISTASQTYTQVSRGGTVLLRASNSIGYQGGPAVTGISGQVSYAGGNGAYQSGEVFSGACGGAAGYSGNGGRYSLSNPGGGGGGGWSSGSAYTRSGNGGGVGLYGEGASGVAGTSSSIDGKGGSGGEDGNAAAGVGAKYGGGVQYGDSGGKGAVRLIWGNGRSFPNNAT